MDDDGTDAAVGAWLMGCFVCCGYARDQLDCLHDALTALAVDDWSEQRAAMEAFKAKHFRTDGAYGTYLHYLTMRGLEEHGGCSPGWITAAPGKRVLAFLDRYGADESDWPAETDHVERAH